MKSLTSAGLNAGCRKLFGRCSECVDWEPIPFHQNGGVCLRARGAAASWLSMPALRDTGLQGASMVVAPVRVRAD